MEGNVDALDPRIAAALSQRGFHFRKWLGKGAFGHVMQAECKDDKNSYAIKVIPLSEQGSTKYHERELKLLIKLESSKNIIRYFSSWILNIGVQCLYIQMELCWKDVATFVFNNEICRGGEIIKDRGSPRFYKQVFPQILNGLVTIHSIGWVHRDIHPKNILIALPEPKQISDINVKITDFGIARHIGPIIDKSSRLTDAPKLELSPNVGNELFRAPELETGYYDYKVDLYSAGLVLYFLSCYLPKIEDWSSEIFKLRNGERQPHRHLYHQDDKQLVKMVELLLMPDPKKRPSAAKALEYLQAKKPTERPLSKFFVRKSGDGAFRRCSTGDDTLLSLKDAIHNCIGIEPRAQVLEQEYDADGRITLVSIISDTDAREMFESAEAQRKKVRIRVSEKKRRRATRKLPISK